jgi:integrase
MGVRVREKIRGSGEWWIFISHRRKRASKKIGTRKAAKEAAVKIEREIALERFNLETPEERRPLLFRQYAERWMKQHAKVNCKPETVRNYRYALDVNLLPAIGDKDIRAITRDDVKTLCFDMKQKGLSPGVVKLRGTILGGIFNAAIEDGLLVGNPAIRLGKIVKVPSRKGRVDFLNPDESRKLLDAVLEHFPRWFPFFLTALRTGMRVGELIALQWEDIDWNGKFIEVRRAISRGEVGTPKNGKPRRIDLSDRLSAVLTDHRKGMAKEALAQGRSKPDRVFVNPEGGELQASSVVKPYRRILTKAGLRRLRFHDLRHSFASALLANGEPLAYVKEQMGHSSIQITVDVYGHLEPGANREAVNRLDDPEWKIQGRKTRETAPPAHPEEITRQGNTNNSLKELAIQG